MNDANLLDRRAVVATLLADRGDLLVVGGLGASAWDVAAVGDHPLNFCLWGAMGQATMIGLGLALARPDQPVLVVTGDGEMLMGMGSLATVAIHAPANLAIAVLDNSRYGETGNQETHTAFGTDLAAVARASGIPVCEAITTLEATGEFARQVQAGQGCRFARIAIADDQPPKVLPPKDAVLVKTRFRAALALPVG